MKIKIINLLILISSVNIIFCEQIAIKENNNEIINTSLNWSGYIAATNLNDPQSHSVNEVNGSWYVPKLKSKSNSLCIIWIGIDGFESSTIEQIGTAHQIIDGKQVNFAWFSMHPNSSYMINNFEVNINDIISACVIYQNENQFKLKISNETTKQVATIPLNFTNLKNAKRKTAQWIVESTEMPFSNFEKITFFNCSTVINDVKGEINNDLWQNLALKMILNTNVAHKNDNIDKNTLKAIPSKLSSGNEFEVKWVHE